MPVAIAFTVETDGRLPSGEALGDAIVRTDRETSGGPDYYMINCAHPTHFEHVLEPGAPWVGRIRGLRANASELLKLAREANTSHARASWPPVPRPARETAQPQRPRRLLRHRTATSTRCKSALEGAAPSAPGAGGWADSTA
jgi:hypothetical protein